MNKRPASPSRRAILAAAPAAAALSTVGTASGKESPILNLIERHKAAWRALDAACFCWDLDEDDSRLPALSLEWKRASAAESEAFLMVCACPTASARDARVKARYLGDYFRDFPPSGEQVAALLRSMMA
ncbi:hypothetical protein [Rhodoblastus sp.]|uniref:hypothetical protein n=1 Tax=Rhodoblastus sp. TaxID=1962975 RepID=UPI0026361EA0|nr:hypothetical protein [Rhodoblastus sp.]